MPISSLPIDHALFLFVFCLLFLAVFCIASSFGCRSTKYLGYQHRRKPSSTTAGRSTFGCLRRARQGLPAFGSRSSLWCLFPSYYCNHFVTSDRRPATASIGSDVSENSRHGDDEARHGWCASFGCHKHLSSVTIESMGSESYHAC